MTNATDMKQLQLSVRQIRILEESLRNRMHNCEDIRDIPLDEILDLRVLLIGIVTATSTKEGTDRMTTATTATNDAPAAIPEHYTTRGKDAAIMSQLLSAEASLQEAHRAYVAWNAKSPIASEFHAGRIGALRDIVVGLRTLATHVDHPAAFGRRPDGHRVDEVTATPPVPHQ
jgi:hypothetical protein